MSRSARYDDVEEPKIISRTNKNQDLYKDVYLNNTIVDINEVSQVVFDDNGDVEELDLKEKESIFNVPDDFEEKKYDLNDYLKEAKERRIKDNLPRNLQDTEYEVNKVRENKDEISQLIQNIEQKEKENRDLLVDLLPDNDNTIMTDPIEETKLSSPVTDTAVIEKVSITKNVEQVFNDININDNIEKKKLKKLPIIICIVSFLLLLGVIILVIILQ